MKVKPFFELDELVDNFGFCESESDVDYFCFGLKNKDKFKLEKHEIAKIKENNWEYFSVQNFTHYQCKEYLEEMLDKKDFQKLFSALQNIF